MRNAATLRLIGCLAFFVVLASSQEDSGKRIYLTGFSTGAARNPAQAACVTCHRASGMGGVEGGVFVPPITGRYLFHSSPLSRSELFSALYQEPQPDSFEAQLRSRSRPAYNEQTLRDAIREGRDPTGRELSRWMPRYALSDEDMASLSAYLKSLSSVAEPGVTDSAIHFATIVAGTVPSEQSGAMLDVIRAWFRWKNADTARELAGPLHSPAFKDEFRSARREWVLHEWTLQGPSSSWESQLESLYQAQPVFSIVSGIGVSDWLPVHNFCERTKVPCIFPNSNLPPGTSHWNVYFNQGLTLQAQALAHYLSSRERRPERIVQVYREDPPGIQAAEAFRAALAHQGVENLEDRIAKSTAPGTADLYREVLRLRPSALVLWLDDPRLDTLTAAFDSTHPADIFIPASLVGETPDVPASLRPRTFILWPFTVPGSPGPTSYRVHGWLNARHIPGRCTRIQLDTWFAVSRIDDALTRMHENLSREYLMESIEDQTESAPNPGVFPRLSLGPGQRFASKGCYILKYASGTVESSPSELASNWIVP